MAVLKPWEQVAASQTTTQEESKLKPWEQVNTDQAPEEEETSFSKGFVEGAGLTQQISDIATAYTGIGGDVTYRDEDGYGLGFTTPSEKYGSEFADASFDERRKMINKQRADQIKAEYGDAEGSTAGNIVGMILDPTSALPVGATYKGMAVIGGGLGATFSATDQLLEKGSVDPLEVGLHALGGAVAAPVLGYAFVKAGQGVGKVAQKSAVKSANKALDDLDSLVSHHIASGLSAPEAMKVAGERLALTSDDILNASKLANRKVKVPSPQNAKAIKDVVKKASIAKNLVEGLSSRIREESPKVFQVLRNYERKLALRMGERKGLVQPFLTQLNKYPKKVRTAVNNHLINGDYDAAKALLTKGGAKEAEALHKMLKADGHEFKKIVGNTYKPIANYFPRKVRDLDGLREALGRADPEAVGALETGIKAAMKQEGVEELKDLSERGLTQAVARAVNKAYPKVLGGAKAKRSVDEVPPELMKYYEDANTALLNYVESSTRAFEKTKLLGNDRILTDAGKKAESILYRTLGEEVRSGRVGENGQRVLKDLIHTRFGAGEEAMNSTLSAVKNIGYMATLGQLRSAATQIKDLGTSAYLHGVMPTIKGALNFKSNRLEKSGLIDTVSAEMATTGGTTKLLDKVLKASLFRTVDRFGKRTLLEASSIKGRKLASSAAGIKKLRKKYGEAYGDDFDALVVGLRNNKDNELTDLYRFHEISDTQPISLLEMPKLHLDNPNGRIAYALKSFGLKQLTLLHNDIIKRGRSGDKKGAALAALRYAAMIGIAGGTVDEVKDVMAGEDFNMEDIPDNVLENLTSLFFVNAYSIGDIQKGDWQAVTGGLITPPTSPITGIIKDVNRYAKGVPRGETKAPVNMIKTFPVVGSLIESWALGGKEKAIKRYEKEKRRELRER